MFENEPHMCYLSYIKGLAYLFRPEKCYQDVNVYVSHCILLLQVICLMTRALNARHTLQTIPTSITSLTMRMILQRQPLQDKVNQLLQLVTTLRDSALRKTQTPDCLWQEHATSNAKLC